MSMPWHGRCDSQARLTLSLVEAPQTTNPMCRQIHRCYLYLFMTCHVSRQANPVFTHLWQGSIPLKWQDFQHNLPHHCHWACPQQFTVNYLIQLTILKRSPYLNNKSHTYSASWHVQYLCLSIMAKGQNDCQRVTMIQSHRSILTVLTCKMCVISYLNNHVKVVDSCVSDSAGISNIKPRDHWSNAAGQMRLSFRSFLRRLSVILMDLVTSISV